MARLKRFKTFNIHRHYKIFGPSKSKEIESRPEHIDKIVHDTVTALGTKSRYHDVRPHPYHPVHEERDNEEI